MGRLKMQNRNKANLILIIVFITFVIFALVKYLYMNTFVINLIYYALEASLVGGIADWFAVTALFTKPLGFSWHTAIIPRNRKVIVEKVTEAVRYELLSTDAIIKAIDNMKFATTLENLILHPRTEEFLDSLSEKLAIYYIKDAGKLKTIALLEDFTKKSFLKMDLAGLIVRAANNADEKGDLERWLSRFFVWASQQLCKTETTAKIYEIIKSFESGSGGQSSSGSGLLKMFMSFSSNSSTNLLSIATLLQDELAQSLIDISNTENALFKKIYYELKYLINEIEKDTEYSNSINSWKNSMINQLEINTAASAVLDAAPSGVQLKNLISSIISGMLSNYAVKLSTDGDASIELKTCFNSLLHRIVKSEHYIIGEIVKDTMETFTDDRMNKFIEDKAGEDLQWIRINGSFVGGIAGILVYLVINLMYKPYILPLIKAFFGIV